MDFLGEVAQRRADPERFPASRRRFPTARWCGGCNAADEAIPGDLRVVAGDIEGDSVMSWLKTLLADAFYWTDNDLVVQTRSMYGGAPRAAGATFVFDQGGKVSHFNYFRNERTAEAIVNALLHEAPQGFRMIGPLSWAGESPTGVRDAVRGAGAGVQASDKPAVFVLPGILGSNLKVDGKRIWLSWRLVNGLKRLEYTTGRPDGVEPDGPIDLTYDDLDDFLAQTHEVIEFAFDWRRPIEEEAQRLAQCGRSGTRCARAERAAGAHRRAFDGRAPRAHPAARAPRRVEAHDGAPRRTPADARHAQRRFVGADAGAVGRRHVRQHAGRVRRAVSGSRGTRN